MKGLSWGAIDGGTVHGRGLSMGGLYTVVETLTCHDCPILQLPRENILLKGNYCKYNKYTVVSRPTNLENVLNGKCRSMRNSGTNKNCWW